MKLFNYYSNNIDRTWYKSSNIVYTECYDIENELKKLKVVFSTGSQYLYEDVNVHDYIKIREAESQGQTLNKWLKEAKPSYTKLENANLEKLNEEYELRSGNVLFISNNGKFELFDNEDNLIFTREKELNEDEMTLIQGVLKSLNRKTKNRE